MKAKSGSIETGTPTGHGHVKPKQDIYFQNVMVCQA